MEVAVIGAGYVGLVTAAGLAAIGHRVRVGESDPAKRALLESGTVPFHEAGLSRVVGEGLDNGLLSFHASNTEAVAGAAVVLIALPTPSADDGSADLSIVEAAIEGFAPSLESQAVVALKSTVPVGSARRFQKLVARAEADATVVSNPEFLREGSAVTDFFHPDRIIIGTDDERAAETLMAMYEGIQAPVVVTGPESSELVKYASNAYLATRITFANAIANVCEAVGADVDDVLKGMGYDRRIGFHFFRPGPGYGGSCFPKDTRALVATSADAGYDFSMLRGVIETNDLQLDRVIDKVRAAVPDLDGARIGLWGLAFKAGTDDTRESPALRIAIRLADEGALVSAFDPAVAEIDDDRITVADDAIAATADAEALIIATEWAEFVGIDLRAVRDAMGGSAIIDARNLLDPPLVRQLGLSYVGVGH
jgi:UDPglucose 6-dehydrogenase